MRFHLASVLLCVVGACGDSGTNKLADAPSGIDSPHGGSDARAIDAPLAPVTVIATAQGAPATGVKVYFLNADHSVVSNTTTGSDGTASAVMAAGGSVTAIEPILPPPGFQAPTQSDTLDTWLGVKPGDQLHLDLQPPAVVAAPVQFSIVVPTDPAASTYTLDTSCGRGNNITPPLTVRGRPAQRGARPSTPSSNQAVAVTLAGCTNGVADMLVTTRDQTGTLVGVLYAPATAVAADTTVTLTGAYVSPESDTFTFSGLGSAETGVSITKVIAGASGEVFDTGTTADFVAGAGSALLVYPPTTGTEQIVETSFSNDGSIFDSQNGADWAPEANTFAYDQTRLLPHFTSQPAFDVGTATLSWTQDTATRAIDFTEVSVQLTRTAVLPDSAVTQNTWTWHLVAPGADAGSVAFPVVPTDVFDYNPAAQDSAFVQTVGTASIPGGYDLFRGFAYTNLNLLSQATPGTTGSAQIAIANPRVLLTSRPKTLRQRLRR